MPEPHKNEVELFVAEYEKTGQKFVVKHDTDFIYAYCNGQLVNKVSYKDYIVSSSAKQHVRVYGFFYLSRRNNSALKNLFPLNGLQGPFLDHDVTTIESTKDSNLILTKGGDGGKRNNYYCGYRYADGVQFLDETSEFTAVAFLSYAGTIYLEKERQVISDKHMHVNGFRTDGTPVFETPVRSMWTYHFESRSANKTLCIFEKYDGKKIFLDGKDNVLMDDIDEYSFFDLAKQSSNYMSTILYERGEKKNLLDPETMKPLFPEDFKTISTTPRAPAQCYIVTNMDDKLNYFSVFTHKYLLKVWADKIALVSHLPLKGEFVEYSLVQTDGKIVVYRHDNKQHKITKVVFKNSNLKQFDSMILFNPDEPDDKLYYSENGKVYKCDRTAHELVLLTVGERYFIFWFDECLYEVMPATIKSISSRYNRITPIAFFRKPDGTWFGNILFEPHTKLGDPDLLSILYPFDEVYIKNRTGRELSIIVKTRKGEMFDLDVDTRASDFKFI